MTAVSDEPVADGKSPSECAMNLRLIYGMLETKGRVDLSSIDSRVWLRRSADLIDAICTNPPAAPVGPRFNYEPVYEYADKHKLNYNELCELVRQSVVRPADKPQS